MTCTVSPATKFKLIDITGSASGNRCSGLVAGSTPPIKQPLVNIGILNGLLIVRLISLLKKMTEGSFGSVTDTTRLS